MSANIGESAGDGTSPAAMGPVRSRPCAHRAHRRASYFNVVENVIAVWSNDELINAPGRVGKDAGGVPVPMAVSVDRQLVE